MFLLLTQIIDNLKGTLDGKRRQELPTCAELKRRLNGRKVPVELPEAQAVIEALVRLHNIAR